MSNIPCNVKYITVITQPLNDIEKAKIYKLLSFCGVNNVSPIADIDKHIFEVTVCTEKVAKNTYEDMEGKIAKVLSDMNKSIGYEYRITYK